MRKGECSRRLDSASIRHTKDGNAHSKVLLKLLNTRVQFPAGLPSTLLPASPCLFKAPVCIKLPKTHSLDSLGGMQQVHKTSHLSQGPCNPRHPHVLDLSVFLPFQLQQSCLSTCPQPSWWHWPGEMLLLLFNVSCLLTFS